MWQKRPVYVAKEACLCGKRGLFTLAYLERPVYVAKEPYKHTQTDLSVWQKIQKKQQKIQKIPRETCLCSKRGLKTYPDRPVCMAKKA